MNYLPPQPEFSSRLSLSKSYSLIPPSANPWPLIERLDRESPHLSQLSLLGLNAPSIKPDEPQIIFQPFWQHFIHLLHLTGWVNKESPFNGSLSMERTCQPRHLLGEVGEADLAELHSLFATVFGTSIEPSLWDWKYSSGRSRSLLARLQSGKIVAHYGAIERHLMIFGSASLGLQVCDVMVERSERGLLGRNGAFFKVACAFQESYFGHCRHFQLAFGFPNDRAMKVAESYGLYKTVDRIVEMTWLSSRSLRSFFLKVSRFRLCDTSDRLLNQLWSEMSSDLNHFIAIVRDASYLRFRYFDHPTVNYTTLLVSHRLTRRPLGLVILREDKDHVKLMDILGKLSDIPSLIEAARSYVHQSGVKPIKSWVTPNQMPFFEGKESSVSETDIRIPSHSWTEGMPASTIEGRWWTGMGDTDFM